MVTFGLGGLGGRLLPMDIGNLGPKGTRASHQIFGGPGAASP